MSLDVYLETPDEYGEPCWNCKCRALKTVYSSNITHNLGAMAVEAGVYQHLWRPEEIPITKASELIAPLTQAVAALLADPERFKKHNSPNGWGMYEHFVPWVQNYLEACKEYPEARVQAGR